MTDRDATQRDSGDVTRLLARMGGGDDAAVYEQLMPLVHRELHELARGFLIRERPDHTLDPTALVNEAFLRLAGQRDAGWESKGHFFAIAATAMRRILVDHARRRRSRGGERKRPLLDSDVTAADTNDVDLLALDDAMTKLARLDPRKVSVVELRHFLGLDIEQTAAALAISTATVKREWRMARLWLKRDLTGHA